MCGILGIARARGPGERIALDDRAVVAMRDRMVHRGPDGAGLWRSPSGHITLAHRRLAVVDLSSGGAQPFVRPFPAPARPGIAAGALVYNGELYNDLDLRRALAADGVRFTTTSDTETVWATLAHAAMKTRTGRDRSDPVSALRQLRGMFSLGWYDSTSELLVLARDPLGIKPLYVWTSPAGYEGSSAEGEHHPTEIVFASDPRAILAHPRALARPDLLTISAYMSTIRTTLGRRTMFAGIETLLPGEVRVYDLSGRRGGGVIPVTIDRLRIPPRVRHDVHTLRQAALHVRCAVSDSVRRHLRSDVGSCLLLSGGLDSTIIAAETIGGTLAESRSQRSARSLRTYCSGHNPEEADGDLAAAARVAREFGTIHSRVPIDAATFADRWIEMVERIGLPLSTPNEIAINQVARRLRADGQIVALSGEGADELFGGYDLALIRAAGFERQRRSSGAGSGAAARGPGGGVGAFLVEAGAWMTPAVKAALLREPVWSALEHDAALEAWYAEAFEDELAAIGPPVAQSHPDAADHALHAHLRMQRRVNLSGLLSRLDTATMLEGVEGRTPFADVAVADCAEALPMRLKFREGLDAAARSYGEGVGALTKIALREAYACDALAGHSAEDGQPFPRVPEWVLQRPKASFPLPFQQWMAPLAPIVLQSDLLMHLCRPESLQAVASDPAPIWNIAWPLINIALWERVWWG